MKSKSRSKLPESRIQDPESRITPVQALAKIQKYCAYQERSHREVKNKLFEYGLFTNEVEEMMSNMINDNFLNEERFARAFAGGKFRMKKWGKIKITHELEGHGLTSNCIHRGLQEISSSDYKKTLVSILKRKAAEVKENNLFSKRNKVARFAIGRGFEPELVWEVVKEMLP